MSDLLSEAEQVLELDRLRSYVPGGAIVSRPGDVVALALPGGYEICHPLAGRGYDLWRYGEPDYGPNNERAGMSFFAATHTARALLDDWMDQYGWALKLVDARIAAHESATQTQTERN